MANTRRTIQSARSACALGMAGAALICAPSVCAAPISKPRIDAVRCWPTAICDTRLLVPSGGYILIVGEGISSHATVHFSGGGSVPARRLRTGAIVAAVPLSAASGPVRVSVTGAGWSNESAPITPTASTTPPPKPSATPFDGNGMWIWEMPNTERGNVAKIIAKARANDVTTLFIKSGDGTHNWTQFSRSLLDQLHAAGLLVCAWPYVYGANPRGEAKATIRTLALRPDCLAIDAEAEYEGRYPAASIYISAVRRAAGPGFPISLAGFPYADYHPSFPYSVFFQPGGAQFNQPQAYWRDIGRSVDQVLSHTWAWNQPWGRPIVPLGQLWQSPKPAEIRRFRALSLAWGASGFSWWDWQESPASLWPTLGERFAWPSASTPVPEFGQLSKGSKGDLVRWLQVHLNAAGSRLSLDGGFGTSTKAAVSAFQTLHGLSPTGVVDTRTWRAILRVKMPLPDWAKPNPLPRAASSVTSVAAPTLSWQLKGRNEFKSARADRLSR